MFFGAHFWGTSQEQTSPLMTNIILLLLDKFSIDIKEK